MKGLIKKFRKIASIYDLKDEMSAVFNTKQVAKVLLWAREAIQSLQKSSPDRLISRSGG